MSLQLTFYGAAGGVTGSKHLLTVGDRYFLLDCGLFQGLPDVRERNRSLPFRPELIEQVTISHAHLDHIGMLPILVRRGFTGSIFATPATRDVCEHMLADMAAIEAQDATYRQKHHLGAPGERQPLFTPDDVQPTMAQFVTVPYVRHKPQWQPLGTGVQLKFYDAGHILGSAVTVLEIETEEGRQCLAYTGDLGPSHWPLLHDPEIPTESIETLILESTYGSRLHDPLNKAIDRLADDIKRVTARGGKMVMPAFSLGRTQNLVYILHRLTDEQRIPRLPIFVDSPLATDITEVFRQHTEDYDIETTNFMRGGHAPLAFTNLTYTRSVEESKALNNFKGSCLIISSSGMMTGGRVIHHLRQTIADPKNAIFITGYQAAGTLGRRLLEGAKMVELYGDTFPVRAEILLYNEFSGHADRRQLRAYAERLPGLKRVILVHGEPHQADDFEQELKAAHPEWVVCRPNEGDTIQW